MSIYKRGDVWWIRFTTPDGSRVRKSAGTKDERAAQALHDRLKAEAWRTSAESEDRRYTWEAAVVQWLKEKKHKASITRDMEIFRWADRFLGGRRLEHIDRVVLFEMLEDKAAASSPSTANRCMALIRAVLRRARDVWEWVDRVPKVPMLSVQSRRTRWITRQEAARLISELPEHLADMARFSLATGLRQRNVCRLSWSDVNMERKSAWIHPDQSKNRHALPVPLNANAMAVLESRRAMHEEFVFTYRGNPITQVNTKAWRKAVARAGLEDFRWHDLRHTWASWHVQAGTPLNVLQELGGWKSAEMVRRYAHLSSKQLQSHAERVNWEEPGN